MTCGNLQVRISVGGIPPAEEVNSITGLVKLKAGCGIGLPVPGPGQECAEWFEGPPTYV